MNPYLHRIAKAAGWEDIEVTTLTSSDCVVEGIYGSCRVSVTLDDDWYGWIATHGDDWHHVATAAHPAECMQLVSDRIP